MDPQANYARKGNKKSPTGGRKGQRFGSLRIGVVASSVGGCAWRRHLAVGRHRGCHRTGGRRGTSWWTRSPICYSGQTPSYQPWVWGYLVIHVKDIMGTHQGPRPPGLGHTNILEAAQPLPMSRHFCWFCGGGLVAVPARLASPVPISNFDPPLAYKTTPLALPIKRSLVLTREERYKILHCAPCEAFARLLPEHLWDLKGCETCPTSL